jgi:hypothetical protein
VQLAANAARRGGGGEPPFRIKRDRADRPVIAGMPRTLGIGDEPVRVLELEARILGVTHGALADEEDVRRLLEDRAGERDGVAHPEHAGARSRLLGCAVHDSRVHLDVTFRVQHGAAPCVEERAVFEQPHGRLDRVKRWSPGVQQLVAGDERLAQGVVDRSLVVDLAAERLAGPSVDEQDGCDSAHRPRSCQFQLGR